MDRFKEREEEFELKIVDVSPLEPSSPPPAEPECTGLLCCRSTDEAYVAQWGEERFDRLYRSVGVPTIWGFAPDSGLRPCPVYLRHCALAAEKLGPKAYDSFLDDTFLVDRVTTLRKYLADHPEVMTTPPPPELAERYGG
eukprot:385762-Prymnesium_polylepis.1